jgi:3-oxoacyl-[acyl-carrier protein] reductase
VISLTQTFALELGCHGITVNTVVPGMIETQASQPVRDRLAGRNGLDDLRREIPLGRFGTPDDVASAIAHLCSDNASYTTGDIVNITGGHVLS